MASERKKSVRLADFGWSWEGAEEFASGEGGVSLYGLGELAEYFGVKKVVTLYRPNDELAMEKLRPFDEVTCEASFNRPIGCGDRCVVALYDARPTRFLEEARNVGALSLKYPNLKGAYIDDSLGSGKPTGITPELYTSIYDTLKKVNPSLKLWALVFFEQLYNQDWAGFKSHMETISLWIWNPKDLANLDRHVDRCREIFPNRPLMLGCYLWDYPSMKYSKGEYEKGHAISMDLLKVQWKRVLNYVDAGKIDGYILSIGGTEITAAPEQARWIRDFIAAN